MPTLIPYWFLQYFLLVGHISSNCFLHTFWFQNAYQKPFQNEVRALEKSMQKTYLFLTSIFWRFGLDFDASWASKMEPKSQFWLENIRMGPPWSDLKLNVSKNSVLEGSGLDFGGPGPRFWRVWGSFFKVLDVINRATNAKNRQKAKNAQNACQNKTSITNAPRMGGRRWSPPGGFN